MVSRALRLAVAFVASFFALALPAQTPTTPTVPPNLFGITGGGSVELGQKVTLQVSVSGPTLDLSFQWRRNGTNLPGATALTYVIEAVTAADSATYTAAVSNTAGSSVATTDVTVKPAAVPVITTQPRTTTASVGQTVAFSFAATGSFPRTYQWRKDGTDLAGGTDATLTLTAITTAQAGAFTVVITNALGSATSTPASLTVNAATPPVISSNSPFDLTATQGASATFSSSLIGGSSPFTYQWLKNGTAIPGATNSSLAFTAVALADAGRYSFTLTNPAGTATSREATLTVNPPTPVTIFSSPSSQTLFVGQSLNLSVSTGGSSPFTYQWRKNDVAIPGATSGSFSISSTVVADSGSYSVVVTNAAGSVTSGAAVVTINPPVAPTFTTQPASQNVAFNSSISLNVQVSGSQPFTFAWKKDGAAVSGGSTSTSSTSSSYSFSSATPTQSGSYTVTVTNAAGSVTSNAVTVTVAAAVLPTITTQPADRQVAVGLSASFSISVNSTGAGSVTFQWLKNGVPISNANSSTYSISAVKDADAGDYTVLITGGAGSVTSSVAKLTVLPPSRPLVNSWPSSVTTGTLGSSATLAVDSVQGSGPFSYQWSKNGVPVVGATISSLRFSALTADDFATYTVTISNDGGVTTSPGLRITATSSQGAFGAPPALPWLDAGRLGDVIYFLGSVPARIERYDLASERWLTTTLLSETQVPTAFAVTAEGVYLAYGRTLARRPLDLSTETPLANAASNISQMFVYGNFLYYNSSSSGSSSGSGSANYSTLQRTTLQAGPTASIGSFYGPFRQIALAPSIGKGFGRSTSISPGDILMFSFASDGKVSGEADAPYHGTMPVGSRPVVLPGDQLVADDSGTIYRTSNLTYAGSFGEGFTDLAFLADGTPVVLRGTQLSITRSDNFIEQGRATITRAGQRLFTRGSDTYVFSAAVSTAAPFSVVKVAVSEFSPATTAASTSIPTGRYSIDDAFLGENNIVHLFSRTLQGFVRWNPATRLYLPTVPLRDAPTRVVHQPGSRRALAHYPDGIVTEIPLTSSATERPLFPFGHFVRALTDLNDFVSVNFQDAQDSGDQRLLFGLSTGPKFMNTSLYEGAGLAWQAGTRRLYSTPAFSSAGLQYEVVSTTGTLGTSGTGGQTTNATGTVTPPIRFNAEGSLLVSKNGRVLNADLAQVGVLANDITDAAWLGNALYTIRDRNGGTEIQAWARASYLQSGTRTLPGAPVRTFRLSDTQFLVVSSVQGFPSFAIVNADLTLAEPAGSAALAGTYFGRLGATGAGGDLALYLRADRTGVLLVHLTTPRAELVATNVVLGFDGALFVNARDLAAGSTRLVVGTFASDGLTGSIPSLNLTFSATKSAAGPATAGYYAAPAVAGANGSAYSIIGSDGRALLVAQHGSSVDGGAASFDAAGQLTLTSAAGTQFAAALTATGGLAATAESGAFTATSFAGLREGVARTDRLANISTRGRAGAGDDVMIAGFVLAGTAPRPVLIRAIGPTLGGFGVPGTLADPRLELFRGTGKLSENDNWSTATNATELAATTARVGGFALAAGSADAALLLNLDPGAYTAQVSTAPGGAPGNTLVEVYDTGASSASTEPRLINIATRGRIAAAGDTFIAGIVVTGNAPKRLLIRAIGPGLAAFGVPGTLPDPQLVLTGPTATGSGTLATNDDWSASTAGSSLPADIAAAAVAVGAFALPASSKDACLLLTLAPGNYTAQVLGKNATGVALVEVYEVNN